MQIIGNSTLESKVIDSLKYNSIHKNAKNISDEISKTHGKLSKIGYIDSHIIENIKKNDSIYIAKFSLGERIKSIHIYIGKKTLETSLDNKKESSSKKDLNKIAIEDLIDLSQKKDTITLPYEELDFYLNNTLNKLEQNGYAFAKLKLANIEKKSNFLIAELKFEYDKRRQLNSIVIKSEDSNKKNNFPEGYLNQINRKYYNKTFNQDIVQKIHEDFNKYRFVNQIKYPEILFTTDTTKVFIYLGKQKSNTFDGIIGFANNENNKLVFNGFMDLVLENTLKIGEQFSLYWKSDGNQQKTFKTSIDLPYIFNSPLGLKAQLQIFKQDSIFQNTKSSIDLGFFINYNSRIYIGYQNTESNDIQNKNNNTIRDFKNSFFTSNLEYLKPENTKSIFSKKTNLSLTIGYGKRTTSNLIENNGNNSQFYININAMNNFHINKKNCININYQNYFLKSDIYIINELFRFGGINSIRGFTENSLQASYMTALITEYRYIISPELYIHSILDYGYYEDRSIKNKEKLLGIGFGFGIKTKNGLLKLVFSNGTSSTENIKLYNTIVSLCYTTKF